MSLLLPANRAMSRRQIASWMWVGDRQALQDLADVIQSIADAAMERADSYLANVDKESRKKFLDSHAYGTPKERKAQLVAYVAKAREEAKRELTLRVAATSQEFNTEYPEGSLDEVLAAVGASNLKSLRFRVGFGSLSRVAPFSIHVWLRLDEEAFASVEGSDTGWMLLAEHRLRRQLKKQCPRFAWFRTDAGTLIVSWIAGLIAAGGVGFGLSLLGAGAVVANLVALATAIVVAVALLFVLPRMFPLFDLVDSGGGRGKRVAGRVVSFCAWLIAWALPLALGFARGG